MRLTVEYHGLPPENREFRNKDRLEDPDLFHYALFSDNILAAAVVVNSTIIHAKVCFFKIVDPVLVVEIWT
jgi:alpha-1,4-galacturonosyltransferase